MATETVQIALDRTWKLISNAVGGALIARTLSRFDAQFYVGPSVPSATEVNRRATSVLRLAAQADKVWARSARAVSDTLQVTRVIDAGNPALPAPQAVTLSNAIVPAGAAPLSEIGQFIGLVEGDEIMGISPNDGRVLLSADRTGLQVGRSSRADGTFDVTVRIRNTLAEPSRRTVTLTITLGAGGGGTPLSILGVPGGGEVGTGSTFTPIISGGTPPYTLSLASGTLPPGRTVNGAAKTVTGSYTTAGTYSYVLRATDAKGATADLPVSLTVMAAGSATRFGLVTATKDGSTGQTYTLNAPWTALQWHRMALAAPFGLTPISGATASTYVATAADEGSRLVVTGTDAGVQKAAKAVHVVSKPPLLLEDFESLTGWTASNGAALALATDSPAYGTSRLQVTAQGQGSALAVKNDIGTFDTSTLGTLACFGDFGFDEHRQNGGLSARLRRFGAVQGAISFGTAYETPSPYLIGKRWGALHVSEDPNLSGAAVGTVGVQVGPFTNEPHTMETKFDALLGRAGGRPTVILGFDDNELTQYNVAFPIMQARGLPGVFYLAEQLTRNGGRMTPAMLREMYDAGWDCGLDSTHNDDISSSFLTMAAWEASFLKNRDWAIAAGMTRGNEHICYTHGQIENNPPSNRVTVSAVTSDGSNVVTLGGTTTAYPTGVPIAVGMRVVGYQVPNSPVTTVTEILSATQVRLSANVSAQTTPMYFVDTAPEFATMKLSKRLKELGIRTARTTKNQGGMHTRFGYGDAGMFSFGNALHFGSVDGFKALIDATILRGLTIEWYTHGIFASPPSGHSQVDEFTAKMDYLKEKVDAGVLDVMTPSQVWLRDGNAGVPANLDRPAGGAAQGVSYVGGSSANNAPAMPSGHKAGDLLLAFAYRDGGSGAPTLPAGWTQLSSAGADSNAFLLAYKIATSDAEPAATFATATNTIVQCYRGVSATTPIGAVSPVAVGSSGSANVQASSWALQKTDGTSWVAYFGGSRSSSSAIDQNANRVGHTNATSGSDAGGYDTYGPVTTLGNLSIGNSGGTFWYAIAVELRI